MQFFPFGKRVADTQLSVVGNADNVPGVSVFGKFPFLSQKHHRRRHFYRFARAYLRQAHAAFEVPGA